MVILLELLGWFSLVYTWYKIGWNLLLRLAEIIEWLLLVYRVLSKWWQAQIVSYTKTLELWETRSKIFHMKKEMLSNQLPTSTWLVTCHLNCGDLSMITYSLKKISISREYDVMNEFNDVDFLLGLKSMPVFWGRGSWGLKMGFHCIFWFSSLCFFSKYCAPCISS